MARAVGETAGAEVAVGMVNPPVLTIVDTIQAGMEARLARSVEPEAQIVQRCRPGSLPAPARVVRLEESQQVAPSCHNDYKMLPHLEADSHSNDKTYVHLSLPGSYTINRVMLFPRPFQCL